MVWLLPVWYRALAFITGKSDLLGHFYYIVEGEV